jgi:hypothetical protein
MDDALLVRGFERFGDLLRDRECVIERDRAAADALRQVLALDQLHHERVVFDAVDCRDVRMIERRQHLRFAREAREAIGVEREGLG